MGNSGNNHQIHVAIQNHQAKHQATIVESIGNVNNFKLKILFYLGATDSFISPYALEKCGLDSYKHNDFESVEMDSGFKQELGLKVKGCQVDLG